MSHAGSSPVARRCYFLPRIKFYVELPLKQVVAFQIELYFIVGSLCQRATVKPARHFEQNVIDSDDLQTYDMVPYYVTHCLYMTCNKQQAVSNKQ